MRARTRSRLLVLALILALSAVALVLGPRVPWPWLSESDQRSPSAAPSAAALEAARSGATTGPAGPELRAAPPAPPYEGPRGVSVTVLDESGAPLSGLRLGRTDIKPSTLKAGDPRLVLTDALGRAALADLPRDGGVALEPYVVPWAPGSDEAVPELVPASRLPYRWAAPTVAGAETTLRVGRVLPLDVRVVVAGGEGPDPDSRWWAAPRIDPDETGPRAVRVPVVPGAYLPLCVVVHAVGTSVCGGGPQNVQALIHPEARRLTYLYPLRPAVEVLVDLPDEVRPVTQGRWSLTLSSPTDSVSGHNALLGADGRLHFPRFPFYAGQVLLLQGRIGARWQLRADGVAGARLRDPIVLQGRATDVGDQDAELHDHIETDNDMPFEESLGEGGGVEPSGRLRVRLLRPSGEPDRGAALVVNMHVRAHADADGWAELTHLRSGVLQLLVVGAGAPRWLRPEVSAGTTTVETVRATEGGTVEVEVVDAEGRERPCATLHVALAHAAPWIDLVDGVQRLDLFTDEHGKRTLTRLPAGKLVISAGFGGADGQVTLDVLEGGRVPARIVVR